MSHTNWRFSCTWIWGHESNFRWSEENRSYHLLFLVIHILKKKKLVELGKNDIWLQNWVSSSPCWYRSTCWVSDTLVCIFGTNFSKTSEFLKIYSFMPSIGETPWEIRDLILDFDYFFTFIPRTRRIGNIYMVLNLQWHIDIVISSYNQESVKLFDLVITARRCSTKNLLPAYCSPPSFSITS